MPDQPQQQPSFSTRTTPLDGLVQMSKPTQPKVDWAALAMAAQGTLNAQAEIEAQQRQAQMVAPTPWRNAGLRIAGTVGGGIAGIPLGPVGMAAGAATGAALMSNEVVQPREVAQGTREGVNPLVGMMEGFASMPAGPALAGGALLPQLPRVAAGNFGIGTAGDALVQTAETGTVDPLRALQAGGMSAALGVAAPVAGRALMAAPRAATRVAQSPAVQRLLADETGSIGPREPRMLTQAPDAAIGSDVQATPPEMAPMTMAADGTPRFRAPQEGAAPARMAEDVERHVATLKRLGQDDGAINESVYFHTQVADDPMAQAQRGLNEPQAVTLARGEALRKSGVFEVPTGKASKMKFSVEDAAAMRREYAVREEFLTRLREQVPADLRTRLQSGDPEAAATVRDLSTKYGVNGIDGLERLKQETALAALEASIADKNIGTAQGRGLALRRARISLTNVPDADFLRKATEKGLPVNEALQVLDELDDPAQRLLALRKLANPTAQDKIRQVIFTSLLSVPVTHAVNLLSSTASIIGREALRSTVVTGVDRAVSQGARQIANPPFRIAANAYWQGMKMGAETGWFMLTKGYDPSRLADNIDRPLEAFTGKVSGPVMQAPTRLLGAADAFMAQPVYWAEVARRSTAKALNEGVTGDALAPRIEQLMKDHELDDALVEHVNKYVETVLFKQKPGKGTRVIGTGVSYLDEVGKSLPVPLPLGTMLVPFRGTPASILRQGFKASGGGLFTGRTAFKNGDVAQGTQDVAEAVVGLGLLAALTMNFADGTFGVVGQLPENEFERGSAYRVGQKPWSLRVGDRHYPMSTFGPLAIPLSMAAAYTEAFKRDPKRPALEPFSQIIAPGLSVMLDSTMLKSGADFFEAIRNPRASDKVTGRFATMLIPYAGALRTVRDQMDPVLREPGGAGATARFGEREPGVVGMVQSMGRNVQEEVEASLPYLSENVRPRFDSFGQPIDRPDASARVLGTDPGSDPVGQELIRLKSAFPSFEDDALYPGNLNAAITEMENTVRKEASKGLPKDKIPALESFLFSDEERNTYKMVVGGLIGDTLAAVIAHPKYAAMSDEKKADVIRNERNRARKMGVQMFRELVKPTVTERVKGLVQ